MGIIIGLTFSAHAGPETDREEKTYKQLELFSRVLSHLQTNYVEDVDEQQLMYGAIRGMLETLDPHTVFMPPHVFKEMKIDTSGEYGGVGFEVARQGNSLTVVAPIDDTPASRAGLRAGDQITKIDGEICDGMDVATALQKFRGPAGKRIVLTIMREGFNAPRDLTLIRERIRIVSVDGQLYEGIAHVKLKNFQDRTDAYLRKELKRLKTLNGERPLRGVVLDLRNNPGGLLDQAVAVSDRFLKGNLLIVSTQGRQGRTLNEERSKERETEPEYPMVVLVNAGSASASEIVAGALQDHRRAVVMGVNTFGKGSVQTVIELEDGSGLKLTVARYFTPSGRSIQELGIQPDYWISEEEASSRPSTTREKDLRRHLKNKDADAGAITASTLELPQLQPWPVADKLNDRQLKTALLYLNDLSSSQSKP